MPWTIKDVDQFKKDLTDKEKEQWVEIANSAYEACMKDGGDDEKCAASAIKQANGTVGKREEDRFEPPDAGDAPKEVKDILVSAYDSCRSAWVKDHPDDKENEENKTSCAKQAWAAVKNAGWEKNEKGEWNKRNDSKEMEIRIIPDDDSEVRTIGKSRFIEGYGIVFNKESHDLGGFKEIILPEATEGVIERSDILALLNHDVNKGVLARSDKGKGTLELNTDKKGVRYIFEAPKFNLGDELLEGIRRGDIKGSSFGFSIAKYEDAPFEKRDDGTYLRTIKKFDQIFDMSPCYREAYEDTSVALRSLDKIEKDMLEKNKSVKEDDVKDKSVKPAAVEPATEPIIRKSKTDDSLSEKEQRNINNLNQNTMLTIKQLQDLKASALEENDKTYQLKDAEKRSMTPDEEEKVRINNQRIKEWDLQIETESRKLSGTDRYVGPYIKPAEVEAFSLIKAIRAKMNNKPLPPAAVDLSILGGEQMRKSGQTPEGEIIIPNREKYYEKRADILAGTADQGQEIVAEEKKAILPPLVDKLVFSKAGATYMPNLVGDVSIPSYAGTVVDWKGEVAAAADGGAGFTEVSFAPKRLTGYVNVSKTFLAQDGVGAERLLLDNIANAVARKLEATILGPATVAATYPSGIGYKLNAANGGGVAVLTGATITNVALIGLETTVDTANALDGHLAYITNGIARGLLKGIDKGTANDTGDFLCSEDNKINGYPLLVTNAIVSTYGAGADGNMVAFGNWKDLCIVQWGGYDITVDPYTAAKTNQIVLVVNAYFDAKGLRGLTGAGATLDEYAVSFSALSIK